MRLLADENVPAPSVDVLRAAGHDVALIRQIEPGASDARVLELARMDDRVLLTLDRDFGRLIFSVGVRPPAALIYVRQPGNSPRSTGDAVAAALARARELTGHMMVIGRTGVRIRPYPAPRSS